MSDHAHDFGAWRTEHHNQAQAYAFHWAERANAEYGQAVQHEDDARARQNQDSSWQRDRMAEERRQAQFHGTRSVEAIKLAEMWARVAQGLAAGELPLNAVLESTTAPTSLRTAP
ncbi:hypothetical protein [Streptomyces bottropensis]|uniref:hypothetical protein n=1 Tax=Streptomyces bottropensis TaxID=42235 RepID=UPI0036C53D8C